MANLCSFVSKLVTINSVLMINCHYLFLKCLEMEEKALITEAMNEGALNEQTFRSLVLDIEGLHLSGKLINQNSDVDAFVIVNMLVSPPFQVPINLNSTVKDVKIFLGEKLKRDPKSFRLIYSGNELRVKSRTDQGYRLQTLLECGVKFGSRLQAIISISKYAGACTIGELGVDAHGNSTGRESDLGLSGGFVGLNVTVLCLYKEKIFDHAEKALIEMGFEVVLWEGKVPSTIELQNALLTASQLWIVSTNQDMITPDHIQIIKNYHQRGGALYLWGDNDPFNIAVNTVIASVLPGIYLCENYEAQKYLNYQFENINTSGFSSHPIFTGIQKLYEGYTIARFRGTNPRLKYIMYSSEGQPALGVCDDNFNGCGRIAVDVGFTRLYCNWDDAGTAKFVKNIAAWLMGMDQDWM